MSNEFDISCPVCRVVTNMSTQDPVSSLTINHPLQNIIGTLIENYQSRSPSPDVTQEIIPAFPPPASGVDYSFSALPPRTPSPVVHIQTATENEVSYFYLLAYKIAHKHSNK